MSENTLETMKGLLDKFTELNSTNQPTSVQKKTFLEITGYGHYENLCSNILKFYFDTREEHEARDFFISTLLKATYSDFDSGMNLDTKRIVREHYTTSGLYIDILIETEESIIIIENKIHATVQNNLKQYKTDIEKEFENKNKYFILLNLRENEEYRGFTRVTYKKFLDNAENMREEILSKNEYINFFFDHFVKTINNIYEGNKMDLNITPNDIFCIDKKDGIDSLIRLKNELDKKFYHYINILHGLLNDDKNDEYRLPDAIFLPKKYCGNVLYQDFLVGNVTFGFDFALYEKGLLLQFLVRQQSNKAVLKNVVDNYNKQENDQTKQFEKSITNPERYENFFYREPNMIDWNVVDLLQRRKQLIEGILSVARAECSKNP